MTIATLITAQVITALLSVGLGDSSQAEVQVVDDPAVGHRLEVDCIAPCARPIHYSTSVADSPLGFVDLDRDGLVYSVWGTGCCYTVRVWRVTSRGVSKVLETGSRSLPSLVTNPRLAVVTYMRPIDQTGRETSMSLRPVRWTYRQKHFARS